KTRSALYKKGLAQAEQNQPQQAIATLQEVVKRFPNTSEAQNASAKIRDLRPPARKPGQ
ncbi:MAG: tetratricopeptide repeat protein, partial [Acidobacteria bacterium]|nr:tetratricopeptide repeat protein [Acidobacteriota bacterium]